MTHLLSVVRPAMQSSAHLQKLDGAPENMPSVADSAGPRLGARYATAKVRVNGRFVRQPSSRWRDNRSVSENPVSRKSQGECDAYRETRFVCLWLGKQKEWSLLVPVPIFWPRALAFRRKKSTRAERNPTRP